MFVVHETLPNKKNWKNNAIPIYKSPHLWYGSGFFLLKKYSYAFIVKQMQNKHFLKGISCNFFKISKLS